MTTPTEQTLEQLIERAAADPDFKARLASDPLGTAQAEGYALDADDLKTFLGRPGDSEAEIVEELKARVSHGGGNWGG
jgi:hypothetical protein